MPLKKLHMTLRKSNPIDISTIIRINQRLYDNKIDNYEELLKDNFETRKEELFSKNPIEELEEMIQEEAGINK
jgi:hypothetical protein